MSTQPVNFSGHSIAPQLGVFPAVITSAPTAPATADSIAYTIKAYISGSPVEYAGVKPTQLRLAGSADTVPARVGDPCLCFLFGNKVYFWVIEQPSIDECE